MRFEIPFDPAIDRIEQTIRERLRFAADKQNLKNYGIYTLGTLALSVIFFVIGSDSTLWIGVTCAFLFVVFGLGYWIGVERVRNAKKEYQEEYERLRKQSDSGNHVEVFDFQESGFYFETPHGYSLVYWEFIYSIDFMDNSVYINFDKTKSSSYMIFKAQVGANNFDTIKEFLRGKVEKSKIQTHISKKSKESTELIDDTIG